MVVKASVHYRHDPRRPWKTNCSNQVSSGRSNAQMSSAQVSLLAVFLLLLLFFFSFFSLFFSLCFLLVGVTTKRVTSSAHARGRTHKPTYIIAACARKAARCWVLIAAVGVCSHGNSISLLGVDCSSCFFFVAVFQGNGVKKALDTSEPRSITRTSGRQGVAANTRQCERAVVATIGGLSHRRCSSGPRLTFANATRAQKQRCAAELEMCAREAIMHQHSRWPAEACRRRVHNAALCRPLAVGQSQSRCTLGFELSSCII